MKWREEKKEPTKMQTHFIHEKKHTHDKKSHVSLAHSGISLFLLLHVTTHRLKTTHIWIIFLLHTVCVYFFLLVFIVGSVCVSLILLLSFFVCLIGDVVGTFFCYCRYITRASERAFALRLLFFSDDGFHNLQLLVLDLSFFCSFYSVFFLSDEWEKN